MKYFISEQIAIGQKGTHVHEVIQPLALQNDCCFTYLVKLFTDF